MTARGAAGRPVDAMADITRLNERTIRILGQNPSQFTLNGARNLTRHKHISNNTTDEPSVAGEALPAPCRASGRRRLERKLRAASRDGASWQCGAR